MRWRWVDLKRVLGQRFGVDLSEVSLGRVLKKLGFSHISARPQHPVQDPEAIATFKKTFTHADREHDGLPETPIEVWFQDEMRVGQKNSLVYQWTKRIAPTPAQGSALRERLCVRRRLSEPRYRSCPHHAVRRHRGHAGASRRDRPRRRAGGAHALLILDKAGWHTTGDLDVPQNVHPDLPAFAGPPELNPVENVWQYLRSNVRVRDAPPCELMGLA